MRARVSVLTIVFVLMGCKLELRERPGPPALPLDGIWLRQDTFADPRLPTRVLLEIRQQAKGGGYDFKLFTVAHRDLLVSGKTCIYTDIKGQLLTSPREVLLRREGLRSGFIPNTSKAPGPIWPMDAYETEILDREIARAVDILHLTLSADGNSLQDSEFNFIRAVPYKPGAQTPSAIAAVLRVTQDQKQVQIHHNLPDLVKKGGMFDLLRSGAPAGKVRITAANDREATGEVTDGKAAPGDILALSGKMMPQQKMNLPSKQEVLDKVKRGEYVPREILIQVLEKP